MTECRLFDAHCGTCEMRPRLSDIRNINSNSTKLHCSCGMWIPTIPGALHTVCGGWVPPRTEDHPYAYPCEFETWKEYKHVEPPQECWDCPRAPLME